VHRQAHARALEARHLGYIERHRTKRSQTTKSIKKGV
jgi:hypothetical protein